MPDPTPAASQAHAASANELARHLYTLCWPLRPGWRENFNAGAPRYQDAKDRLLALAHHDPLRPVPAGKYTHWMLGRMTSGFTGRLVDNAIILSRPLAVVAQEDGHTRFVTHVYSPVSGLVEYVPVSIIELM